MHPHGVLEGVAVDQSGRFTLSPRVRDRLEWLQAGMEVLAVVEPAGRVRLLPWEQAEEVRLRLSALAQNPSDASSPQTDGGLMLMARYARVFIETTHRLELPGHVAAHLNALGGGAIFIVRLGETVELWSTDQRERHVAAAASMADDLP